MANYKSIVEFFEDAVLNEGKTDVQSHVGFMNINNNTAEELVEYAFGGTIIDSPKNDISNYSRIIYIYTSDDYGYLAAKHFSLNDKLYFSCRDSCDQYIICFAVAGA